MDRWIDELEYDLGVAARLRLIANAGGQRRYIPQMSMAGNSKLAGEVGPDVARWLADRFSGTEVDIPSKRGMEAGEAKAALMADLLDAGLVNSSRTANDLALAHGVTVRWVHKVKAELLAERRADSDADQMPLFPGEPLPGK
ncbi:hypothetical protein [Paracoccus sp. (in: a-proteobacteria)]|uniref:hypothetical protein n=1 Tax=Paracoccus sp. TaxID=267 RepID=UPI0026DFA748|nr:hypothetical protein [Paracoccus sp. (in: a-proteobacteria)]MDO5648845.1 hypothetical protein [Paracoccus sp. (in: a-proteobacteria)]